MSRRHRGRPHHHAPAGAEAPRRGPGPEASAPSGPDSNVPRTTAAAPPRATSLVEPRTIRTSDATTEPVEATASSSRPVMTGLPLPAAANPPTSLAANPSTAAQPGHGQNGDRNGQCTAPQLRRFIKSRPYVPMHELRRRFSINGDDDDVTPVRIDPGWIYVGLPVHEGHLLGDLLRTGEIGYELSLDPRSPIVIGVYPMRPIPRT